MNNNLTKLKSAFKLWMKAADFKVLSDGDFERFQELLKVNGLKMVEETEPVSGRVKTIDLNRLYKRLREIAEEEGFKNKDHQLHIEYERSYGSDFKFRARLYKNSGDYKDVAVLKELHDEEAVFLSFRNQLINVRNSTEVQVVVEVPEAPAQEGDEG